MRWSALLVAAVALLPACESGKGPTAPPPLAIAAWFGSEPMTLDDLKGKVVILDFWNIGCPPCRKLMPHLAALYAKHKAEGLVVIGITNDEKGDLEAFLKENPAGYPIAMDTVKGGKEQTFDAYGIGGIPYVWVIARDGSLAWKGPGDELTDATVATELAKK
ncbi:MAG: TlpA family protein disulfide reductase [Planctomycetes bacterium]|nr:TlpA family protein disulfide reductase [Planctomycetota bacterium]